MPEPETKLKDDIRNAGLTMLKVADRLGLPYGTLAGQLNGFSPLSYKTRILIEQLIKDMLTEREQAL